MRNVMPIVLGVVVGLVIALVLIAYADRGRTYPKPHVPASANRNDQTVKSPDQPWWKPDAIGLGLGFGVGLGFGRIPIVFPIGGLGLFFWWLVRGRRGR